uniref:hypothetical protein n=1 Tax=Roseivirga sp. TaxID=1964215 RepID=UPI0040473637
MNKSSLTKDSTEEEIGKALDRIRQGELSKSLLVELLSERHNVYAERPSYQMNRIKGYVVQG